MRSNFETEVDNLVKESGHFVEKVFHGGKVRVALTCLKGVITINREVATRKLLL